MNPTNENEESYCDICGNTEYKLGVFPIRRTQRSRQRPSGRERYNLGSGIYLNDPEVTEREILARNYPNVEDNSQTDAVFVPETFLPPVTSNNLTPIETNIELFKRNLHKTFRNGKVIRDELRRFKGIEAI